MQQEEKKQIGTTDDLSKDMIFEGDEYKNKEGDSQSTASEGELKKTGPEEAERDDTFKGNEEDSPDNTVGDADRTSTTTLEEDEKPGLDPDDITS